MDLADYVAIAAEVTGLDPFTIMRVANLDLADSALHAPAAGFGGIEFYPDFVDKASVLIVRLARNHPLPDGNERAARLRRSGPGGFISRSAHALLTYSGMRGHVQRRGATWTYVVKVAALVKAPVPSGPS